MKNLNGITKITKRKNGTRRVQLDCSQEQITDQSHKNMADINNIVSNYHKTGVLPHTRQKVAQYLDTYEIPDLIEAHELINNARSLFMELPAHIRKLMDNNPQNMEDFIGNPENHELLVKYGVLTQNKHQVSGKQDVSPNPPAAATKETEKITE